MPIYPYFELLSEALNAFCVFVHQRGGEFVTPELTGAIHDAFDGGVPYGQTVSRSFQLLSLKGKSTKKYAHCVLYRMESGRYELTNYIF